MISNNQSPSPFRKFRTESQASQRAARENQCPNHSFTRSTQGELQNFMVTCVNHPDKSAEFISEFDQNDSESYCHKCAILLASQGFVTKRISRNSSINSRISQKCSVNQETSQRKNQVNSILQKLKVYLDQIQQKKKEIFQNLLVSEEFYGEQIEEIEQYFKLVIQSLQLQKNKCYNYILNERKIVEKPLRATNQQFNNLQKAIQKIYTDISANLETVFDIEDKVYKLVMGQYQYQFQDYQKQINSLRIWPVELHKIEFTGVPDQIYSISDVIIQSSTQSNLKESIKFHELQQKSVIDPNNQNSFQKALYHDSNLPSETQRPSFSNADQDNLNLQKAGEIELNSLAFSFDKEGIERVRGLMDSDLDLQKYLQLA